MQVRPVLTVPRVAAVALGVALALPTSARAQDRLHLVPFAGLYIPTGKVVDEFWGPCVCQSSAKQKTNFIVGTRVTLWLPGRVGFEGTFAYSPSGVTHGLSGFGTVDTPANVITASAKVLARVGPPSTAMRFHVGGGVGVVGHGGPGYRNTIGGTTDFGAILNAGVAFKVGPSLALRLDAEDHLFNAQFEWPTSTDSKFQNDLVVSLGLAVPLMIGRR